MRHLVADQTVTLHALRYNGDTDTDTEICTKLTGVSWYEAVQAAPSGNGLVSSSLYKIRVFEDQLTEYLPFVDWHKLTDSEKQPFWTIALGDKLTHGGNTVTIIAIHDNRASRRNPHLYLEAK